LYILLNFKVIIHSFEDTEKLSGIAFLDVNMYVNSIKSIKNFILIGDAFKSIWFCAFQVSKIKLKKKKKKKNQ